MALVQKPFSDIITFTRASGGGRFNAQGQYEWLAADQPRIDYDPVTGECMGLLIEESRTNLLLNSATLATQTCTVTAATHTLSFYGTGSVTLSGAATGTLTGTGAGNRVSLTFNPAAGALTLTVSGTVTSGQLEQGGFPTSYVPTADAQVTRAADVASVNELSPWFNASEGTLYFKGNSRVFSRIGQTSVWLQQGGYTGLRLYRQNSTQLWTLWNTLDGQGDSIADVAANLGEFTHAASYSSSGISTSANGGTPTVVQANRTGFAPTSLRIGAYNLGYYFNGHIESIRYFPHALASEELQRITA